MFIRALGYQNQLEFAASMDFVSYFPLTSVIYADATPPMTPQLWNCQDTGATPCAQQTDVVASCSATCAHFTWANLLDEEVSAATAGRTSTRLLSLGARILVGL